MSRAGPGWGRVRRDRARSDDGTFAELAGPELFDSDRELAAPVDTRGQRDADERRHARKRTGGA